MGSVGLYVMLSLLIWMVHGSPQLRRANDRYGQCTYTFTVPSPKEASCSEPREAMNAVQELRVENAALRQLVDSVQTRVALLERVVNNILGGEAANPLTVGSQAGVNVQQELEKLRMEKDEWEGQRGSLEMAYSDLLKEKSSLEEEKQKLNDRLEKVLQGQCPKVDQVSRTRDQQMSSRQDPWWFLLGSPEPKNPWASSLEPDGSSKLSRWEADGVGYQELKSELTALPASRMIPETQSALQTSENKGASGSCGELTWVGEPTTFRKADSIAGKYGVWMKDPDPITPFTQDTIWRINTVGADIRQVMEYENTEQLSKGYPAKVYVLPRSMESNGAVVYKGSLYYQRRKSRILVKYDFNTETVAVQKELPNSGYHGKFPYSWGGYTDIDFAVDEMGLWVIYSTENLKGSIVISQLDPKTLDVKQSWETPIRKQSVANAFLICGTLYTVGSYSSSSTTVNFAFDTRTGVQRPISVPFQNQYGYASMLDYNPTEKKIYGWDNYNMVAYDVRLSKM